MVVDVRIQMRVHIFVSFETEDHGDTEETSLKSKCCGKYDCVGYCDVVNPMLR